jgi:hypothetical protein
MPSNAQLDASLNQVKSILQTNSQDLNSQGKKLVADVTDLLNSLQSTIATKNADGRWQRLLSQTKVLTVETAVATKQGATNLRQQTADTNITEKARLESREFYTNLKDVLLFVLKSGEFREILLDSLQLFHSMARKIDQRHGDRLTDTLRTDISKAQTKAPSSTTATTTAVPVVNTLGSEQIVLVQQQQQQPLLGTSARPTETKQLGREAIHDVKNIWSEEEDRRREMQQKFETILDRLSNEPQFNVIVNKMLALFDQMEKIMYTSRDKLSSQQLEQQNQINAVIVDVKAILGDFAGQKEVNKFWDRSTKLSRELRNDPEALQYFKDLRVFIVDTLRHASTTSNNLIPTTQMSDNLLPQSDLSQQTYYNIQPQQQFVTSSSLDTQRRSARIREFIDRGKAIFQNEKSKYSDDSKKLLKLSKKMLRNIKNDSSRVELGSKFNRLMRDMFMDDTGRPDLFVAQESISQMQHLLSNVVRGQLIGVPLPLIEGATPKMKFAVRNMVLDAHDILPDHINVQLFNNFDYQHYDPYQDSTKLATRVSFRVESIRMRLNGVHYDVQYLGTPKFSDNGIVDVEITGPKGFSLQVDFDMHMSSKRALSFSVFRVHVNIDKLNINIRQAKHKFLDKMVLALFKGVIKKRIASTIEQKLTVALQQMATRMNTSVAQSKQRLATATGQKATFATRLNSAMKTGYDKRGTLTNNLTGKIKQKRNKMKSKKHHVNQPTSTFSTVEPMTMSQQPLTTFGTSTFDYSQSVSQQPLSTIIEQPIVQQQQPVSISPMNHPNILPYPTSTSSSSATSFSTKSHNVSDPVWDGNYSNQQAATFASEQVGLTPLSKKQVEQQQQQSETEKMRLAPA